MAFVYEVNGQRVEFDKEPTEQDIDEAAKSLGAPAAATPESTMGVGSAVTGAAFATPTGAAQAGRVLTGAVAPYAKEVVKGYLSKPLSAAADVGLMAVGAPPVVGPVQGFMDRAGAIKQGMMEASKQASMGSPTLSPVKGVPTTATVRPYFDMLKSAPGEVADKISDLWNNAGGNNAVKRWLNSAEGQALRKAMPEFGANAAKYIEAAPTALQQAGRMAKPLAVGAARVAGPAMMAYDVNNAMEFAREQQLGQRLAQGQGGAAQRAFRNMNVQYGYQPTAQEAENLLASGAARDIQAFGGEDRLRRLIREEAAKRVVGPVAPR
jgi:hypothetical protein